MSLKCQKSSIYDDRTSVTWHVRLLIEPAWPIPVNDLASTRSVSPLCGEKPSKLPLINRNIYRSAMLCAQCR